MKKMMTLIAIAGLVLTLAGTATAGLLAAWEFNDGDVSGTDVNATSSTVSGTTGQLQDDAAVTGGVLALDGADDVDADGVKDYLRFGSPADLKNLDAAMTIAAWVKFPVVNSFGSIVVFDDNYYFIQGSSAFGLTFHGGQGVNSTTGPTVDTWTHVVGVYESGQPLKIYVNGVFEAQSSNAQSGMNNSTHLLFFGAGDNNSGQPAGDRYFQGDLDDIAIWDEVLPLSQIEALAGKDSGGYTGRTTPTGQGGGGGATPGTLIYGR